MKESQPKLVCTNCLPIQHCITFEVGDYRYQYQGDGNRLLNVVVGAVEHCPKLEGVVYDNTTDDTEPPVAPQEPFINERPPSYPVKRGTGEIIP